MRRVGCYQEKNILRNESRHSPTDPIMFTFNTTFLNLQAFVPQYYFFCKMFIIYNLVRLSDARFNCKKFA